MAERLALELQKVADDLSESSTRLSHFLDEQAAAVEKLELQVDSLTSRVRVMRDVTGVEALRSMQMYRPEVRLPKVRTLSADELTPQSRDLPAYTREKINLTALDRVGSEAAHAPAP